MFFNIWFIFSLLSFFDPQGFIAAIFGVVAFKEIEGTRNYCVLAAAYAATLGANALIVLSH